MIALPAAHDRVGVEQAVVGGKEVLLGILADAQGGNQVRQHLRTVDAPPNKGVVGDFVILIPGQLGGHEIIYAALLHDLGQNPAVAEHIRQPKDPVVPAKLFPEEPFAVNKLANQGLPGGQVAVCLQPHAALRLPAALLDALLDLRIHLGIALLQEIIQHRLAGHKLILRILLHQLQNRFLRVVLRLFHRAVPHGHGGKGTGNLLPGLGNRPPPSYVDMGVANASGNDVLVASHFTVQVLRKVGLRRFYGGVKLRRIGRPQIQQVDGLIQNRLDIQSGFVVGVHPPERPQRHLQIVVQAVDGLIQHIQIHQEIELPVQSAGVGLNVHRQSLPCRGLGK